MRYDTIRYETTRHWKAIEAKLAWRVLVIRTSASTNNDGGSLVCRTALRVDSPDDCLRPALFGGVMLMPLMLLPAPTLTPRDWLDAAIESAPEFCNCRWLPLAVGTLLDCGCCCGVPGTECDVDDEAAMLPEGGTNESPPPACLALPMRMGVLVLVLTLLAAAATPAAGPGPGPAAAPAAAAVPPALSVVWLLLLVVPLGVAAPGDCCDCCCCCMLRFVALLKLFFLFFFLFFFCCFCFLCFPLGLLLNQPGICSNCPAKFVTHTHTHTLTPTHTQHTHSHARTANYWFCLGFRFYFLHIQFIVLFRFFLCSFCFLFNCLICPIANLVLLCYVCVFLCESKHNYMCMCMWV